MDLVMLYLERQAAREAAIAERKEHTRLSLVQKQGDGPIIREWRRSLWITQHDMAAALGVSEKRLSRFERSQIEDGVLKRASEWYLSFHSMNPGRRPLTTDSWQALRQEQLRQLEWRRANNII